jgi:transposase
MVHITKRKRGKKTYYYLARSFRKDGKPTKEILRTLGTADDLINTYSEDDKPLKSKKSDSCHIYEFGAVAALLHIAERLKIADIIDKYVPKREPGLSFGSYLVLAAINRAVLPIDSTTTFYEWFNETVLAGSFPEGNQQTLSEQSFEQNFWNQMVELNQDVIRKIENEITKNIIKIYNISTNCVLFYDQNFMTYTCSSNAANISRYDHDNEKITELKDICLPIMTSLDHHIPLFHETYPERKYNHSQFVDTINILHKRLSKFNNKTNNKVTAATTSTATATATTSTAAAATTATTITTTANANNNMVLVLDKIKSYDVLLEMLEKGPQKNQSFLGDLQFVGGLGLKQATELLKIKKEQFSPLIGDDFDGTSAYRTEKQIYEHKFTAIITDNQKLRKKQLKVLKANILECKKELKTFQKKLKKRSEASIGKGRKLKVRSEAQKVKNILSAEHMKKVYTYKISTDDTDNIVLTYELDNEKYNDLIENSLGKSIIITNVDNWTNEQIVLAHRSQYQVKENFKRLKNTKDLSFKPVKHFTDITIMGHAFYCVTALTLRSLLRLEMEKLGHKMTINSILEALSKAKQSNLIFLDSDPNNKPKVLSAISNSPKEAVDYIEKFGLKKYLLE